MGNGRCDSFLGLVLYIPFLRNLFQFAVLHPIDIGICLLAGTTSLIWFEFLKMIRNRKRKSVSKSMSPKGTGIKQIKDG